MSAKDNTIQDVQFRKLVNNDNYFKNIFKKTEKIVSVIFYILNNIDSDKKSETHISNIASKAHFAHENALRTLEVKLASGKESLEQFAQALVGLDSTLRIAGASGVITRDVMQTVTNEIDIVLRGLYGYIADQEPTASPLFVDTPMRQAPTPRVQTAQQSTTGYAQEAPRSATRSSTPAPSHSDRRERIKTILEAKGDATIKDISEIITDCSEKTIQRELNAMIDENIIKRQGERRWSRYSIF